MHARKAPRYRGHCGGATGRRCHQERRHGHESPAPAPRPREVIVVAARMALIDAKRGQTIIGQVGAACPTIPSRRRSARADTGDRGPRSKGRAARRPRAFPHRAGDAPRAGKAPSPRPGARRGREAHRRDAAGHRAPLVGATPRIGRAGTDIDGRRSASRAAYPGDAIRLVAE